MVSSSSVASCCACICDCRHGKDMSCPGPEDSGKDAQTSTVAEASSGEAATGDRVEDQSCIDMVRACLLELGPIMLRALSLCRGNKLACICDDSAEGCAD